MPAICIPAPGDSFKQISCDIIEPDNIFLGITGNRITIGQQNLRACLPLYPLYALPTFRNGKIKNSVMLITPVLNSSITPCRTCHNISKLYRRGLALLTLRPNLTTGQGEIQNGIHLGSRIDNLWIPIRFCGQNLANRNRCGTSLRTLGTRIPQYIIASLATAHDSFRHNWQCHNKLTFLIGTCGYQKTNTGFGIHCPSTDTCPKGLPRYRNPVNTKCLI